MKVVVRTLVLLVVALLAGCGEQRDASSTPASQTANPPSSTPDTDPRSDTDEVQELPASSDDPTVWGRHDAPPAGVRSQVEYFGIGDGICLSDTSMPKLTFMRLPWYREYTEGADDPERGETLVLCANGFSTAEDVEFHVEGPDGFVLDESAEATESGYHAILPWLTLSWPIGEYAATARQDDAEATLHFKVVPPTHSGVRIDSDFERVPKEAIDAMLIGEPPDSEIDVDVYKLGRRYYEYATSIAVTTDSEGSAMFRLRVNNEDSGDYMLMARDTVGDADLDAMALVRVCCE